MKLTERLKVEHGIFLKQLALLEELAKLGAPLAVQVAVAETIVAAEEDHSLLEGRVLYPLLEKAVGSEYGPLKQVAQDHAAIAGVVARLRGGEATQDRILELVRLLREHLEREIHGLFALAEEWIPPDRLEALCNWEEEHLYTTVGRRLEWMERLLKDAGH
jgi:hypothetical protein